MKKHTVYWQNYIIYLLNYRVKLFICRNILFLSKSIYTIYFNLGRPRGLRHPVTGGYLFIAAFVHNSAHFIYTYYMYMYEIHLFLLIHILFAELIILLLGL